MNYMYILNFLLILIIKCLLCNSNKFNFVINPNCTNCDDRPWIVYGKKENDSHTIHYLWSAVELPSFIIASSSPGSNLIINWEDLQNGVSRAINFSTTPENVFGISFQTLILFNDEKDTGKLDNIPEEDKKYASLSEFEWTIDQYENKSEDFVVSFSTTSFRQNILTNDTKISISVTAFGEEGRSDSLPHLIKMPDSTQLEILLDNLVLDLNNSYIGHHHHARDDVVPISGFHHPRWALDTIILTNDLHEEGKSGLKYFNKKSLDDEYTPGVFDLNSITSPSSSKTMGGYLQWRPVCYLSSDKDINHSTVPNFNSSLPTIDEEHLEVAQKSLFYALYGDSMKNFVNSQTPIAFGLSKDEYYTKYNYTIWTFSMGLGTPPVEKFSTVMFIIISVGVGLPCLLFIVGGAYLGIKKFRRRGELLINEE